MRYEVIKQIAELDKSDIALFGEKLNEILEHENIMVIDRGSLTKREKEVMALVVKGLSNREIAEQLCISKRTVEIHRQNISRKLHLKSKKQQIIELAPKETFSN